MRSGCASVDAAREIYEGGHHAVGVRGIPLLAKAFVGLYQPNHADRAQRQAARAPRAVTPGGGEREGERPEPAPRGTTLHRPRERPFHQDDAAPHQPPRHATRARDVRPLHQHRRVGERRAEPEPREAHVALMPDAPLHRRPQDRQDEPQGQRGQAGAHPHREPEHGPAPQCEHGRGREVAQQRQGREMPQGDDEPVEH
jgi:hypothetical protein